MPNLQKWVNLSFLFCGIIVWILMRQVFALGFEPLGFNRVDWFVSPSDIAAFLTGFATFIFLIRSTKAGNYLTEVIAELAKVTWPNGKETVLSTGVVSVMLAIATVCILIFDTVWVWIVDKFLYS